MQREKTPEWCEKQKSSRGIRRGQRYRLVFQFPIREQNRMYIKERARIANRFNRKGVCYAIDVYLAGEILFNDFGQIVN